jgi:hypothetical protein
MTLLDILYKKDNKIIGEFIIGDDPHNYERNKEIYDEKNYIKTNPELNTESAYWNINFDSIYIILKDYENYQKIPVYGKYLTKIDPDTGFIISPNEFFSSITTSFFNKYYNYCDEKYIDNSNKLKYIECDNNDMFNISSFPDIIFEYKEFETTFNFTYKDLFVLDETNNKYIFLIINDRYSNIYVIGNLFLRKYQLIFNVDSKTIGYYKTMNNDNNKDNNKDNNDSITNESSNNHNTMMIIFIVILVIISSMLSIFLGMYIQRTYCKRKARINELEDVNSDYKDIKMIN